MICRFAFLCKCPRRQLRREGLISFASIHRIGGAFARHVLHLRDGRRPLLRWRRRMRGCAPTPPLALARPAYALARIISTSFYYTLHARKQSLSTSRPTGHATHTLTPEPSARSRALYEGPPAVPTLPKAPRQRPTRCPRLCGRRLPDERPPSAQSADLGPPGVVRERRTGRPQAQYAEYDE